MKYNYIFLIGAALIGAALLFIRHLSFSFPLGTTTAQHPYLAFTAALMAANFIWLGLIFIVKKWANSDTGIIDRDKPKWRVWLWALLGLSLGYRALFFGTFTIYEDDWNRYLWDGASIVQGVNPYKYTPDEIITQAGNGETKQGQKTLTVRDHDRLYALSDDGYATLSHINNPQLTTIYPPSAQAAFALGALIKPLNLDALRFVFLLTEMLTLFLMIKALTLYGRSRLWVLIYAFNPLLIYSAFNVAHMDIVLPPFIMAALILIRKRPFWAGAALAGAAAVKVWPLILAPILYRRWSWRPWIYIGSAVLVAGLSFILFWPMLSQIRPDSGLSAYSQKWQRSSFLFPVILNALEPYFNDAGRVLRLSVAGVLTALSLFLGFRYRLTAGSPPVSHSADENTIPRDLLLLTLTLLFLSPTGYPWYVIWVIMFIPFAPFYGAALLCALVPLYYVRFALGEQNRYDIYQSWLVPIQFGVPILVLLIEYCISQLRGLKMKASNA